MTSPLRPSEAAALPSGRPVGRLAERWFLALRGADPARLARGRTWARGGRVREFEVTPGLATATVTDGDARSVSIRVNPWEAIDWRRFAEVLRTRLTWSAALLEGQLPEELVTAMEAAGLRAVPKKAEIETWCDCDDWNAPCPHGAAVHAILAEAIDGDPFLLLTLRGRSRDHVLQDLHGSWASAEPTPEDIDDGAIPDGDWYTSPAPVGHLRFDFTSTVVTGAGMKSLGAPPGGADLIRGLAPLYEAGAAAALAIALEEVPDLPSHHDERRSAGPLPIREPIDDEQLTEELVDRLCDAPGSRSQDLADALRLPMLRVRHELIALEKLGIVYRTGATRGTRWWVG